MATKTMSNPRELFLHELGDVLYAEQMLLRTLPQLEREASDSELAKGFERHAKETKQQVENLQKAFKKLGAPVKAEKCPGIEGIKAEHDQFVREESPAPDVLDAFLTGAAARTEHYEIAAYEGLITMARAMGERDVVQLLDRNLKQEKETLKKVNAISKRLAREGAKKEKAQAKAAV
jgi:ferritin-like metal-binding protein YciE